MAPIISPFGDVSRWGLFSLRVLRNPRDAGVTRDALPGPERGADGGARAATPVPRQAQAERDRGEVLAFPVELPADPVGELAAWAAATLKVPTGHPLAGRPMALPDFAESFLRAGWDAHESALCIARKNAKSAICAVLALGYLVGPLRIPDGAARLPASRKRKRGAARPGGGDCRGLRTRRAGPPRALPWEDRVELRNA